jgi:hypothetical protein
MYQKSAGWPIRWDRQVGHVQHHSQLIHHPRKPLRTKTQLKLCIFEQKLKIVFFYKLGRGHPLTSTRVPLSDIYSHLIALFNLRVWAFAVCSYIIASPHLFYLHVLFTYVNFSKLCFTMLAYIKFIFFFALTEFVEFSLSSQMGSKWTVIATNNSFRYSWDIDLMLRSRILSWWFHQKYWWIYIDWNITGVRFCICHVASAVCAILSVSVRTATRCRAPQSIISAYCIPPTVLCMRVFS